MGVSLLTITNLLPCPFQVIKTCWFSQPVVIIDAKKDQWTFDERRPVFWFQLCFSIELCDPGQLPVPL